MSMLLPISSPRTSDVLTRDRLVRQLNFDNLSLENLYNQVSTGRRVNSISDDPAAAITAVSLQASKEYSDQMLRNADSAEGYLNVTDTTSAAISDALIAAKGTVVSAAQSPISDEERQLLMNDVQASVERIVAAANISYRGHYILGGAIEDGAPLTSTLEGVRWSGQPALQATRINQDWLMPTGISAPQTLAVGNVIKTSSDLNPALTRNTPLSALRGGRGIIPGVVQVSSGGAWHEVDLRTARTLGDLEDAFERLDLDGRQLDVEIDASTITIGYADGLPGSLSLDDVGEEQLTEQLGIRNPEGYHVPPLTSLAMNPLLSTDTRLIDLNGGTGINVASGFRIVQGNHTYDIDLSQAETIEDILVRINRSEADVRAEIDPVAGTIVVRALTEGVDYAITEKGGIVATALGLRTASGKTKLSELNHGLGADQTDGADFTIRRVDGSVLEIDVSQASTVQEVINLINSNSGNTGGARVTAALRTDANGISLRSLAGSYSIEIADTSGSRVAQQLGLIPAGKTSANSTNAGSQASLIGSDYALVESGGAIDSLLRLKNAIRDGDISTLTRMADKIDRHVARASYVRGEVGLRVQNINTVRQQTQDMAVVVEGQLSDNLDADIASVISELTARQQSMEASLRVIAQISQLTVLNFL